jgi:predicted DNA-binding transcriptional regulator AlpA
MHSLHTNAARKRNHAQPVSVAADPDALLTIRNACALAGCSPATFYRRVAGDPTHPRIVRIGPRCSRVRAGDLRAWLAAQAAAAHGMPS